MYYQRLEKTFVWIIKVSLYLMVFAPLLLSADYFFPAIFPKAIYLRLLIEAAIVAYIPLVIMAPRFRPRYHAVYVSLAVFAALVLLTSITGENFSYSFWGNYERMDGVFSWLHYWALIVVAASVLKTKKDWLELFSFSVLSSLLLAGYGFLQRFGVGQFGPWTIYETNLGRITGTIGNPAFLAVYLLFNFVFGLLIITEPAASRWRRIAVGAALLPIGGAYVMTGVRGAFVGLVVGVVIFFAGNLFWNTNKRARRLIGQGFLGFVAVLAILYGLVNQNQWVTQNFGRLFSIPLQDSTVQTRLISWRGALAGFKDNFWLGVGPQKFDVVFNKRFDPNFYLLVGDETWWDRAHNIVLEVATTMGILGLLSYFGLALALLASIWQMGRFQPQQRLEALIIASLLAAYFIQNLFVFDTVSSYLALALLMGYIIVRTDASTVLGGRVKEAVKGLGQWIKEFIPQILPKRWWVGLALALIFAAPVAYAGNIKLISHNRLLLANLALAQSQSFQKTIENYKKIFELSSFDSREVAIRLAQYMSQRALSGRLTVSELRSGYDFVTKVIDQVIDRNPKDVRLLLAYGNALNVYGEIIRQRDIEGARPILQKAEQILTAAANLGTARQQVFHSLANTYFIMGERQHGLDTLLETIAISPQNPKTYWLLALSYIQGGQAELGIKAADDALDKNYRFSNEGEAGPVIAALVARRDWERLLRLYQRLAANLQTVSVRSKLAATLAQMGRKQEAIAAAREVLKIDPAAKEQVDDFIQKVESAGPVNFIVE